MGYELGKDTVFSAVYLGAITAQYGDQALRWMTEVVPFLTRGGGGKRFFGFSKASRSALRPSHPHFQPAPMSL